MLLKYFISTWHVKHPFLRNYAKNDFFFFVRNIHFKTRLIYLQKLYGFQDDILEFEKSNVIIVLN